jgi:hypothetical protein
MWYYETCVTTKYLLYYNTLNPSAKQWQSIEMQLPDSVLLSCAT